MLTLTYITTMPSLVRSETIPAHCVHLFEDDLELMNKFDVGVAHTPDSNTCVTNGWCMIREFLNGGIKAGLGTHCSASYSISVLNAISQASNVSRHLLMGDPIWKFSFEELVYLATNRGRQGLFVGRYDG